MKPTITVTYTIENVLSFAEKYGFTKCKRCFNLKTGMEINQTIKNGCIGYYIDRNFYSITSLRPKLIRPKKSPCPF